MNRYASFRTFLFLIFASLFISACGGGGGGGGGGAAVDGINVNTSTISLAAEQNGNVPATQIFEVSWTNANVAVVLAGVPPEDIAAPSWITLSLSGSASPMTLSVRANTTNLPPGDYSMTLRMVGGDSNGDVINIVDIPVTYTVSVGTVASPTSLTFNMIEGQAPATQIVNLNNSGNPVTPTSVSVISGSNWFTATINGNDVEVATAAAALSEPAGSKSGVLSIGHANGSTTVSLILNITAQGLTVSATPTFLIDLSTQTAGLSRDITIGENFTPAGVVDWSAVVETGKPWLTISPATGDTATTNTMTVTIDPSQLGELLNRYNNDGLLIDHTADITLSSTVTNVAPVIMTVTLNLDSPHVMNVSPNVAVTSSTEEIILRGWGFAALTNQVLNCGAQPATSYTVLSDVEIRAICPAQATGVYELSFENSIGMVRVNASLYVEDAAGYVDEVIATTGTKTRILYDAARESIYIANNGNNTLDRYVFDNTIAVGSQWLADNISVMNIIDISQSTDGSYLDVVESTSAGYRNEINPDNLNVDLRIAWGGFRQYNNIAFLSGGESLGTFMEQANGLISSMRTKRNAAGGTLTPSMQNAIVGATRDGRRALVASKDANPAADIYYHDSASAPTMASASMVSSGLIRNATSISSDRTGSKWIFDQLDIYTDQFVLLGSLPATTIASILSHDGSIAYTIDSAGSVRKFDLASVVSMQFTEIGTGSVLASVPGNNPVMTISHDGSRLFMVGDANLVIMAAPAGN